VGARRDDGSGPSAIHEVGGRSLGGVGRLTGFPVPSSDPCVASRLTLLRPELGPAHLRNSETSRRGFTAVVDRESMYGSTGVDRTLIIQTDPHARVPLQWEISDRRRDHRFSAGPFVDRHRFQPRFPLAPQANTFGFHADVDRVFLALHRMDAREPCGLDARPA
jgi:hypothetical protein